MKRLACLLLAVAAASCEKGAPERPGAAPGEGSKDPGAGDVVDYVIGAKQLETKKQIEKELDDIRRRRKEQAEGLLEE